jgi:hypothetical protein
MSQHPHELTSIARNGKILQRMMERGLSLSKAMGALVHQERKSHEATKGLDWQSFPPEPHDAAPQRS